MAGGSLSGSSSHSSRKKPILCNHGASAVVLTCKKEGPNFGRKFYRCSEWNGEKDCHFFKWVCDVVEEEEISSEIRDLQFKFLDKDSTIIELEVEKKFLEDKLIRMKKEKHELEVENKRLSSKIRLLRIQPMLDNNREKAFQMAMVMSWILFGIIIYMLK
ncbi:hypothetical protein BVRB_2g039280 [Beta vulgaris subsp. vulgaris]|nr:hypothetical protein BVRB_2g039280 [Beta vulgaris subsp. vulgaris]